MTTHIHDLWEELSQELASTYDAHGVCAAVASHVASYARTVTVVGLQEPYGRYYDIWIAQPHGETEQTRWEIGRTNLGRLVNPTLPRRHYKHQQTANELIHNDLWLTPRESVLLSPLPPVNEYGDTLLSGLIALVDPTADCPLDEITLQRTVTFVTPYLERAALQYQRDRQAVEFAVISDISHSLAASLRLEEIFERVVADIRRMLDVETVSLALIDESTGKIVFVPEMMGALFQKIPPITLSPGQGIAGWVATHGEPLIVNNAYDDNRFFSKPDNLTGFQTRSILCVPLLAGDEVIGVMEAINKQNGEFTKHDQILLSALSGPLATAIVNARLHQNVVAEKRRMETMFQSMSEGMVNITAEGRITAVNDAMLALLRRQPATLVDKPAREAIVLKEGDFSTFLQEVRNSAASTDYPQLACEIKQNGSFIPVLASGAAIVREDGEVNELIVSFTDLRQIREVERMRDDFFHNVVHELRTPLATILMYARLLLNGRARDDEEKATRFLQVIERESDRLQTMVRQMLQLAKLEAKEIQRSAERVQLNAILEEILPPMADRATEKGLAFIQRVKPDLPPIIADRETVYMIFKNLVENAIKFTITGTVKVDVRLDGGKIIVVVSDEGIGIPEAAMPNLFRRFYRTQTAVERGIAGTGIGLYMVKEGIEKHKGELSVQSTEGKGTTFTVILPAAIQ